MPLGIRLRTRARYRALLPRQGLLPKQCFGRSPRLETMHISRRGRLDAIAKYTEYKRQFVRRVYFALSRRGLFLVNFLQGRGTSLLVFIKVAVTIESSQESPYYQGSAVLLLPVLL